MDARPSSLANRYVLAVFAVQVVGYVALAATFDHSPGPVVEWVQRLPGAVRIALLPVGVLSVPALGIALAVGWGLSLLGLSPAAIPALLVARGDVLVFASAYAVAVVAARTLARVGERR